MRQTERQQGGRPIDSSALQRYESRGGGYPDQGYDPGFDMGGYSGGGGGGGANHHPNVLKTIHRLLRGRYLLTFAMAGVIAAGGAVMGFRSTKPMYQTTGMVKVQSNLGNAFGPVYNPAAFISTQAALMKNDRVIQHAMELDDWKQLGLGNGIEEQEEFIECINISQTPGSLELLNVTATNRNREYTKAAVKCLLEAYTQYTSGEETRGVDAATSALRGRRDAVQGTIKELKSQVETLSREYGAADLKVQIDQKTTQITDVETQITAMKLRLANLPAAPRPEGQAITPAPDTPREWTAQEIAKIDLTMRTYVEELRAAEAKYDGLRERFSEQHQAVKKAAGVVAEARSKVESFVKQWQSSPDAHAMVKGMTTTDPRELLDAIEKFEAIKKPLVDERARMSDVQWRIANLQDQIKYEENNLREVQSKIDSMHTEVAIASQVSSTGRMTVVNYGSTPINPSVDRRKQFAAAGFVLGGGLPVAAMMLLGLVDRRYRFSDDAGESGINAPLLGILPILPPNVRDPERRAAAAHAVHSIRVLLQLSGDMAGAKVFSITSPTAGDGKTSLVLSLGLSFAASGARTVLVDFDTVGTGLSASLDVRRADGVLEAIRTGELTGCIHPSGVDDNLFIIPSAPGDDVHVSRLSINAVRRLVTQLREQFDIVLIDTGPVLGSIEASLATAQSDGVIVVVGRGQQHTMVKKAVDRISAVGGRIAGLVFNRATTGDFRRSMSATSVRSVPRALPAARSSAGEDRGLTKAGPIARTVAREMGGNGVREPDHRAAS